MGQVYWNMCSVKHNVSGRGQGIAGEGARATWVDFLRRRA